MFLKCKVRVVVYWCVAAYVVGHGNFKFFEFLIGHKVLKASEYFSIELDLGQVLFGGKIFYSRLLFPISLLEIFLFHRTSLLSLLYLKSITISSDIRD